jgi:hypothetical protein
MTEAELDKLRERHIRALEAVAAERARRETRREIERQGRIDNKSASPAR